MNGLALAARFAALRPETPVLYTSGHCDRMLAEHGFLPDSAPFLAKPFGVEAFRGAVRRALAA